MRVERFTDPVVFRDRTLDYLMADEPRHNLMIGVIGTLATVPDPYDTFHLWLIEDQGSVVLVSFMTPPFNMTVSVCGHDAAPEALARAIDEDGVRPPGITAAKPELDLFVRAWQRQTGQSAALRMSQRIYAATSVTPPPSPPQGAMRPATLADRDLLYGWILAFSDEALEDPDPVRTERVLDLRLREDRPFLFVWENEGRRVSLVGTAGPTPSGIRIGPVYTPPEHRRHGYATALTAAVTERELRGGRTYCFLYTDLSNPTSNGIYQAVGYRPVCDSFDYGFEDAAPPDAALITMPPPRG
jgi:GNAT superfamily N-acetyltransferase